MRKIKAQLKTQEMAFMMLAVLLFFILAGLFYLTIQSRGMFKQAEYLSREKAKSTVAKLSETPEFSCGEPLCVDADKLIVMENREDYRRFWPLKTLEVIKVFPKQEEVICSKNNYQNCSIFRIQDSPGDIEKHSSFVAVCKKVIENGYAYDKCELGKIVGGFNVE